MNSEAIYQALFELVSGLEDASGNRFFVTATRRLRLPNEIPNSDCPALCQTQKDVAILNPKMGLPTARGWGAELFIYFKFGQDIDVPSSIWNPVQDRLMALFEPDPARGRQTLGGLVTWARIGGKIETFEGVLNAGSLLTAIVPIDMLAPA